MCPGNPKACCNMPICMHYFPVDIRLKSEDYSNLREKLTSPIQVARQVVIRQSLSDQFLAAFSAQVARNGVYHLPPGSPVSKLIFSLFVLPSLMPLSLCSHWNLAWAVHKLCQK